MSHPIDEAAAHRERELERVIEAASKELSEVRAFRRMLPNMLARSGGQSRGEAQSVGSLLSPLVIAGVAQPGMSIAPPIESPVDDMPRSRPSTVLNEAYKVLRNAAPEPVSLAMLVSELSDAGVRLGDDDESRKRRVTSLLSAAKSMFHGERGVGWRLKSPGVNGSHPGQQELGDVR